MKIFVRLLHANNHSTGVDYNYISALNALQFFIAWLVAGGLLLAPCKKS